MCLQATPAILGGKKWTCGDWAGVNTKEQVSTYGLSTSQLVYPGQICWNTSLKQCTARGGKPLQTQCVDGKMMDKTTQGVNTPQVKWKCV